MNVISISKHVTKTKEKQNLSIKLLKLDINYLQDIESNCSDH